MNAEVIEGVNGMSRIVLQHFDGSRAEIYLNGAHVTSWVPSGSREMLYLSDKAVLEPGGAIRGGIPVIFPQFADTGPLPKHGWARTSLWKLRETQPGSDSVTLELEEDAHSLSLWPHTYHIGLTITLGPRYLDLRLDVQNPGAEAFTFTSALHTYLSVGDISKVQLRGLDNTSYIDKVRGGVVATEPPGSLEISSETDRIYMDAPSELSLIDISLDQQLQITSSGFPDVVVWNPWDKGTLRIPDMAAGDYTRMLCVEAAVAAKPVTLSPLETWSGSQRITRL